MKKNIIKIIGGILVVICSFYFGYSYLSSKFKTIDADYGDSFHNMPKDSVDVLVLGSSHAQYSFNPEFFYEDTGLYSYVLGTPYQPASVSVEMLKEALKTQSPKLVVLEVYTATYKKETINDAYYVIAEYQMTGEEKRNVIDMLPKEKANEYKNDFINNHNNWRISEYMSTLFEDNTHISATFGYQQEDTSFPISNYWYTRKYDEDVDVEIDEETLSSLNKLYDICKENDIQLLLYIVPADDVTAKQQSTKNKIWQWANEKGINYIDFMALDEELDYRMQVHNDGYHSYINGASVITDYMAEYIDDNYSFDHNDNETIDSIIYNYIDSYTISVLRSEHNPNKYLNRIKYYPYTIAYSYTGSEISDELNEYLNKIGIYLDGNSKFGIIRNGISFSENNVYVDEQIDGHSLSIGEYGIYLDGNLVKDSDHLTIVVFNKDYSDYVVKRIDYLDGVIWDYKYDYEYNYIEND